MKKKSFKVRVVVKGNKVPNFGLGKGVLSETIFTFTDEKNWGWKHPSFLQQKMAVEDGLVKQVVECRWKEIPEKDI